MKGDRQLMRKLLLLTLLFQILLASNAQRIAGSEIYYEKTGIRQYKITVHVYRECEFAPLNSLSGFVIADTITRSMTLSRISISKINDTCGDPCKNVNSFSNPGFERHVYTGNVDFNSTPYSDFISSNNCIVTFAIRQGGRDNRTTTHASGMYYNEANVNICDSLISNRSPIFSVEPKFIAQCNNALFYSPGPMDSTDYDSLGFSIEPVLVNYKTPITYNQNYSYQLPLTPYCPPNPGYTGCRALPNAKPPRGFFFNPNICEIAVTPTYCNEYAYVRLKISEYRKIGGQMKYIGDVSRDMLISVQNLPSNNLPLLTISPNSQTINLCSKTTEISFTTSDEPFLPIQTDYDSTFITYNYGYSNSEFNLDKNKREQSAKLTLNYDSSKMNKTQFFTITSYDRLCNHSFSTKTFIVKNSEIIQFDRSYKIDTCNTLTAFIKPIDTSRTFNSFIQLQEPVGGQSLVLNQPYGLNRDGRHILKYSIAGSGSQCYTNEFDTFDITNTFPKAPLNLKGDTSVCSSYPMSLRFSPSQIKDLKDWSWYINDSLQNLQDSVFERTIYKASIVKVIMNSMKGCSSIATRYMYITKKNLAALPTDKMEICPKAEFSTYSNTSGLMYPIQFRWRLNQMDTTTQNNTISFNAPTQAASMLRLRLKDVRHCIVDDSMIINLKDELKFSIVKDKPNFCEDSIINLTYNPLNGRTPKSAQWSFDGIDSLDGPYYSIAKKFSNTTATDLTLTDSNDCKFTESITLTPIPNPELELDNILPVCKGLETEAILNFKKKSNNYSIEWTIDGNPFSSADTSIKFKAVSSGNVEVKVGNEGICFNSANTLFTVHPLPDFRIVPDSLHNYFSFITLGSDRTMSNYLWSNGGTGKSISFWAHELGPPGAYQFWLKSTNAEGCSFTDTLTIHTDRFTGIDKMNREQIKIYPNPTYNVIYIDSPTESEYNLLSTQGQLLYRGRLENGSNSINLETLSKGVYLLEVNGLVYKISKL